MNNQKIGDVSGNNSSVIGNGNTDISIGEQKGFGNEILTAVPYIVHESAMSREERHVKRLVIALIISIATLLLSNIGWLLFLSQYEFEYETTEISSEGGGNANYIGHNGDIYNGEDQSN